MSNEEPYRDQAEKLRKKVEKIDETYDEYHPLPPRSERQRPKKKRTKLKVKYPLIRILTVFFILLPTAIFSIYTYFVNKNIGGSEKAAVSSGYETIHIEKQKNNGQPSQDNQQNQLDSTSEDQNINIKPSAPPSTDINKDDNQKVVYHTVQPQETLSMIAMKYYHSKLGISTIKAENHLQDDTIRVGQILRIPLEK